MKLLSRAHGKFINLPLRTKLVLVFAITMMMVKIMIPTNGTIER